MGTAATVTYKRLASLLGTKHSQPFSRTMGWLRCRISFSLLRSEVTYLRGACSTPGHPVAPTCISDTNLDLFTSEAMALTYQRLFLFCTKFLFSCSLKHFQVLFYINFVSAGHHISYKMFHIRHHTRARIDIPERDRHVHTNVYIARIDPTFNASR